MKESRLCLNALTLAEHHITVQAGCFCSSIYPKSLLRNNLARRFHLSSAKRCRWKQNLPGLTVNDCTVLHKGTWEGLLAEIFFNMLRCDLIQLIMVSLGFSVQYLRSQEMAPSALAYHVLAESRSLT